MPRINLYDCIYRKKPYNSTQVLAKQLKTSNSSQKSAYGSHPPFPPKAVRTPPYFLTIEKALFILLFRPFYFPQGYQPE